MYMCYEQTVNFHVISSVSQLRNQRIWFMSPCISYIRFFYLIFCNRQPILQSTLLLVVMSSHILSLCQSSTSPMPYEEMP